jgi:hypothetical protein
MKLNPQYFYKNAEISFPYDLAHRHIRLDKSNKQVWIKLFRVQDLRELRKYLIRFAPDTVYISVSCYLEPELVGLKWKSKNAGYRYLPNILISSDFVLDFDDGVKSLAHLLKAHKYLKTLGFGQFKAIQTKRGFHLWVLDWYAQECKDVVRNERHKPFAREMFLIEKKMELCMKLERIGIEFDKPISMDTRRIVKLWGSLADDCFICRAWDDPKLMAKEVIKPYLSHDTEAKRGQLADFAQ